MYVKRITLQTSAYNEMIVLTPQVEETVAESGVKNGMVTVLTKHTTTGITVNEALECLESDIQIALSLFAPEDRPYSHARMLRDYGSTAGNPTGHLKAMLTGNHCHFLIRDRGGTHSIIAERYGLRCDSGTNEKRYTRYLQERKDCRRAHPAGPKGGLSCLKTPKNWAES